MKTLLANNKKFLLTLGLIAVSPLCMMLFNAVVMSIFNLGTYLGSYIRTIINISMC